MAFFVGLIAFGILGLVLLIFGLVLVLRYSWLLTWLRANIGLFSIAFGLVYCAGLVVLSGFQGLFPKQSLAVLDIQKLNQDSHLINATLANQASYRINTDAQNIRVVIAQIHWTGVFEFMGIQDGMLVAALQGTYSVDGQAKEPLPESIVTHKLNFDASLHLWEIAKKWSDFVPGVEFKELKSEWYEINQPMQLDVMATRKNVELVPDELNVLPESLSEQPLQVIE